jgi:tRNA 2-thiocytidine biosynthesis protein TtcA
LSDRTIIQTKVFKKINRLVGKSIHTYDMISDNDSIVVGLSGGKDSLTLFTFLTERLKAAPIKYTLYPVYIDPGFEGNCIETLQDFCHQKGYELIYEKTDHGIIAHQKDSNVNPCFICSRLRRKRLFEIADSLNCTKLALGHTKDDLIETLFINMFYSGQISTMHPCQSMFNGSFTLIRPLFMCDSETIKKFVNRAKLPICHNSCTSSNTSKRSEIRNFLKKMYDEDSNIKGNIFRSLSHIKSEYMLT